MNTKGIKKKPLKIAYFVSLLVCIVLAWLLFIYIGDLKEKEHFKQMYPNTDKYLQEAYGKYYKKSNVLIRGKITLIFYVDEKYIKGSDPIGGSIEDLLTDKANEVYNHLLTDCHGDVKHLEIIFLTYKYNNKYYNFAYKKPMKKTDEMYWWTIQ